MTGPAPRFPEAIGMSEDGWLTVDAGSIYELKVAPEDWSERVIEPDIGDGHRLLRIDVTIECVAVTLTNRDDELVRLTWPPDVPRSADWDDAVVPWFLHEDGPRVFPRVVPARYVAHIELAPRLIRYDVTLPLLVATDTTVVIDRRPRSSTEAGR